jgi:hypothetical protein
MKILKYFSMGFAFGTAILNSSNPDSKAILFITVSLVCACIFSILDDIKIFKE